MEQEPVLEWRLLEQNPNRETEEVWKWQKVDDDFKEEGIMGSGWAPDLNVREWRWEIWRRGLVSDSSCSGGFVR